MRLITKRRAAAFGDWFLAVTMRSWFAVGWNTAFVAGYFIWNVAAPTKSQFDPYPYSFLCTMLTALSYLQGPVILTMSWLNERSQRRQEEMLAKQTMYQLHVMEAIYAAIKGSPFVAGIEDSEAEGSGIPGDI